MRSYTQGSDWAEVSVFECVSFSTQTDFLQVVVSLIGSQGFQKQGEQPNMQIYFRTFDPVLQRNLDEYVALGTIGQKVLLVRGANINLIQQIFKEEASKIR